MKDRRQVDRLVKWGYKYIRCDKCGKRLKVKIGQKTRLCPYCNKRVKVRS